MTPHSRIEISQAALQHNLASFKTVIPPQNRIFAVVKANAYGHGMAEVVSSIEADIDGFQVDDVDELISLRKLSSKETLILGYIAPDEITQVVAQNGCCALLGKTHLESLEPQLKGLKSPLSVTIAVDLSFGREGFLVAEVPEAIRRVKKNPKLSLHGLYGHFSCADDLSSAQTTYQAALFAQLVSEASPPSCHLANTPGILTAHRSLSLTHSVRLGLGLYGLWPSSQLQEHWEKQGLFLQRVLRWVSRVAEVKTVPAGYPIGYGATYTTRRPTKLALIPLGYSDGISRLLSHRAELLVGGRRCQLLGRVSMNMCVIDATEVATVSSGTEVVIIGKQGSEEITAEEIAEKTDTINYEVVARISALLPRAKT